jgi:hypothetical protein
MPSLYDFAGGEEALHRLENDFYTSTLKDPYSSRSSGLGSSPPNSVAFPAFGRRILPSHNFKERGSVL